MSSNKNNRSEYLRGLTIKKYVKSHLVLFIVAF